MSEHRDLYELFHSNKENRVRVFLTTGREIEGKIGIVSPGSVAVESGSGETWFVVFDYIVAVRFDEKPASAPKLGYR
jgi:hypothetical protein